MLQPSCKIQPTRGHNTQNSKVYYSVMKICIQAKGIHKKANHYQIRVLGGRIRSFSQMYGLATLFFPFRILIHDTRSSGVTRLKNLCVIRGHKFSWWFRVIGGRVKGCWPFVLQETGAHRHQLKRSVYVRKCFGKTHLRLGGEWGAMAVELA